MEKTEKATPKKRKDNRNKGHVMKSMEVVTAVCSLVMFFLMYLLIPTLVSQLKQLYKDYLGLMLQVQIENGSLTLQSVRGLYTHILMDVLKILLPIMATAIVVGVAANILQVGRLFTTEPIKPKLSKISPMKGIKRLFSVHSLMELAKSIVKCAALGYLAYSEYMKLLPTFSHYMEYDIEVLFVDLLRKIFFLMIKMAAILAVFAAGDYGFQWWKYEKDMKMTKQEVTDERKMSDGDPKIKSKQRQTMRKMMTMRMMQAVPSADVVITNPTHYAVALVYEDGTDAAPIVVAKGADEVALRIKELARIHNVPMVENRMLARSLYEMCEVDDMIPQELYQAVADVLSFVWKQQGKKMKA